MNIKLNQAANAYILGMALDVSNANWCLTKFESWTPSCFEMVRMRLLLCSPPPSSSSSSPPPPPPQLPPPSSPSSPSSSSPSSSSSLNTSFLRLRCTNGHVETEVRPTIIAYSAAMSACDKGQQWQLALSMLRRLSSAQMQDKWQMLQKMVINRWWLVHWLFTGLVYSDIFGTWQKWIYRMGCILCGVKYASYKRRCRDNGARTISRVWCGNNYAKLFCHVLSLFLVWHRWWNHNFPELMCSCMFLPNPGIDCHLLSTWISHDISRYFGLP